MNPQVMPRQPYQAMGLAHPAGLAVGTGAASTGELQAWGITTLGLTWSVGGGLWGGLLGAGFGRSQRSTFYGAATGAGVGLVLGLVAGFRAKGAARG